MPAETRLSFIRDLSLKGKVTLTLALAFVASLALFLSLLVPLEREQHTRLLEQNKRLVSTLRDKHQRDLIHDVVAESHESLAIDLADLARQEGILWVGFEAESLRLEATADPNTIHRLLGEEPVGGGAPEDRAALVIDGQGRADLIGPGGERLLANRLVDGAALPSWRSESQGQAFQERRWNGVPVLQSVAPVRAADEEFGQLALIYSLADVSRAEARTRLTFYGLLATAFVLLVLLLNLLISRIVLAPLQRVMDAMRQASRGELRVRLPVHARDEIGTMAESFNAMVGELEVAKREIEDYSRNLERMVEARTHALRASEATLTALKNHLAAVIANVAAGVISLDEAGHVTTFNGRAAEILGLAAAGAEGRPIENLLADGESRVILDLIRRADPGPHSARKHQVRMKRGRVTHTLSVVVTPLMGEGGRRVGSVVVFDDLTQILASQRLAGWKEAVERVIHEIKNPLTPVGLSAQTLSSAFAADRGRFDVMFPSAIQIILDSVRDLKALISEFTQFSRLPEVRLEPLDLNALVGDAVAGYTSEGGIQVRLQLASGELTVRADATQLRRVLLNVINNGFESMEGRSGEVVVATAGPDATGGATLVVRDQGCGVEDVERIFEPYYTTKVKGTGLGLAIARQIVEEHGGEIQAESQPGAGTTVTIRLPRSD